MALTVPLTLLPLVLLLLTGPSMDGTKKIGPNRATTRTLASIFAEQNLVEICQVGVRSRGARDTSFLAHALKVVGGV